MKKILLIILCITMLLFFTACSDKKEDSLKNNGDTLQEEKIGSKLSLEFVNEYPERLSLDHSTKEIYYNDDWYYVIIGKNGELYDEVQKKEVSSDYSPLSSNNYIIGNYNVKIKKNKIGVYYKNKLVVNYSIKYLASGLEKNENKAEISENMIDVVNDALILRNTSYYWDHNYNDIKWSEAKTYLITSEGIKKTYNGYLSKFYDEEDSEFFYNIKDNVVRVYDESLNEMYNFLIENNKDSLSYACYGTSKKNYCLFNNKYIDLFTNEEISEKEANYRVLDNTYGFTLLNNKLVVYENNNIIGEFDNINLYLGGYYFSGRNLGEDGDKLYKLVFNLAN